MGLTRISAEHSDADVRDVPTLSAAEGIAPRLAVPWWKVATGLLGIAFLCVLAGIVVTHWGSNRFGNTLSINVAGAALRLVQGAGHAEKTSFIVESSTDGVAALSAEVRPFDATNYRRVEWTLRTPQPPDGLAFVWRTRENPRRTYLKPLQWLAGGIAPLNLQESDGWRGTITGIGLLTRGTLAAPIEIDSVRFPPASARAVLVDTFGQWTVRVPLKGYAIAFPFDAERADFLAIAQAFAIAVALAMAAYLLFARLRDATVDGRVLWAIFAAGWILLDVRWQADLTREVVGTAERFFGKSPEDKALAADDAAVYALARDLRHALPPPPARVIVLCKSKVLAVRIAYFLYPHNVSSNVRLEESDGNLAPQPAKLRTGEYVAIIFFAELTFDAAKGALVWPDGRTLPAELTFSQPGVVLARIR
jgi:hypothetical protein